MSKKLLRKKLALMLANLKKKRKYYCEVEYLEFSGTQYINTGFKANTTTSKYQTKIVPADISTTQALFGSRNTINVANTNNCEVFIYQNQLRLDWVNGDGARGLFVPITVNTPYEIEVTRGRGVVNGVVYTSTENTSTTQIYDFLIGNFTNGLSSPYSQGFVGKVYYSKLYDNGVLVRDMIPVLDWNYVPCMFDRVTEQFFYNAGTGDFSYGREIHYVDYLESDGTQYIDTGIKLTNNHSVEVDYQLTSARQNRKGIFGGLVSNGSRFGTLLSPSNEYLEFGYGSSNVWYQTGLPDTQRHIMKQQKNLLYFDGVLIYTFGTATFTQNFTAPLGSFNYTNYSPASAKYYGSRWWDGNDLIRDYKPAIDENGVCFWFDKVSHSVFLNAGTGVFSYPVRETEYTGNNGTAAYIDLGAKYKPSMSIEGKYTRDTAGASGSVILVTTTTSAPLIYLPALSGTTTERFVWRRSGYTEQSLFISNITYPYTMEMVVDAVNDTLTLNGNVVKTGMIAGMNGYNSPYQSDSNMMMFSIAGTYAGDGKVYYLKITDGTTPVFDLMPAYKDGDAGFYNKVTGVFFKNASTNASTYLVAGKIVEPEYE